MPTSHLGLVSLVGGLGLPEEVVDAFRGTDRAGYVPPELADQAYADRPIPLPQGQTTSQPTLIAQMIAAAAIGSHDRVLEVGTGYGYQTALLGKMAAEVFSIEFWPQLAGAALKNLQRNGVTNVDVLVGDGWKGRPERAPYDAIVVSAAASSLPEALADQLVEGGRLVIPLTIGGSDDVMRFTKQDGVMSTGELIVPARFVPLVKDEDR